jgi:hypothetical protein
MGRIFELLGYQNLSYPTRSVLVYQEKLKNASRKGGSQGRKRKKWRNTEVLRHL